MRLLTKLVSSLLGTGLAAGATAAYIMNKTAETTNNKLMGSHKYLESIEDKIRSALNEEELNGKKIPSNQEDWEKVAKKQSNNGFNASVYNAKDYCNSAIGYKEVLMNSCVI